MISFYLLWTGCYFVLLSWLSEKWPLLKPKAKIPSELPTVTLLIPFRNELENLENLTVELRKISYPNLKIILIDDHSEDWSFGFLLEKLQFDHRISILKSPEIGKKRAIEFGVKSAESELILCSDADCIFPDNWIREIIGPFHDPKIQLVAGPVISNKRATFFQKFQQIEWSSILLVTQYFFSRKQPIMCSAANLAYRKSAFESVNGYDQNHQFVSGDDEFLLKKISAQFGQKSCVYLPFREYLVLTQPHTSVSSLLNQRIRWAGKWKAHSNPSHGLSAVFSVLVQLIWIVSAVLVSLGVWGMLVFLVVWFGKIVTEKIALGKVLKSFKTEFSFIDWVKTGILHPYYVIFVALAAIRGKFTWKGRGN